MSLCELVGRGEVRTRVECPIRRTQLGRGWGWGGGGLVVLVSGGGVNRNLGACKLVYPLHAHHGQVCPTHQHQIRPALAKQRGCRGFTSKQPHTLTSNTITPSRSCRRHAAHRRGALLQPCVRVVNGLREASNHFERALTALHALLSYFIMQWCCGWE